MKKGENGVWELTLDPVAPGTYRYLFDVDGVRVGRSRGTRPSASRTATSGACVHVPGADFMDTRPTCRTARSRAVYYRSSALGKDRRMHVYTPPGYEAGADEVPGALPAARRRRQRRLVDLGRPGQLHPRQPDRGQEGEADDRGHAGRAHRAVQLRRADEPAAGGGPVGNARFEDDFDEGHPAVRREALPRADRPRRPGDRRAVDGRRADAQHRRRAARATSATSACSAPGSSSAGRRTWEKEHEKGLDDAGAKKGLKLLWFATGKDDFLLARTKETVDLLKKHGFKPVFKETSGGHTWINWQQYLNEFAPQLFQ